MAEKEMRKAEKALEDREKDLTIEALSKQEIATVTISVYSESREGQWITRGPAAKNGELDCEEDFRWLAASDTFHVFAACLQFLPPTGYQIFRTYGRSLSIPKES